MRRMGRGRTIDSRQDMEDYRKDPFLTPNPGNTYCWLPNIWSTEPEEQDKAGMPIFLHHYQEIDLTRTLYLT